MEALVEERTSIKISVRNLVEFILLSGDIDDRIGGKDSMEAMQAGGRIHRKLQKKAGSDYHAEVPLFYKVSYDNYDLIIHGRADGIIYDEDRLEDEAEQAKNQHREESILVDVCIDEIKGMYQDVLSYEEPIGVHLAQAKCYAFIFAAENELQKIDVQMTYVNLDTEEIQRFRETYTYQELDTWFQELLASYKKWADFQYEWKLTRQASIASLEFPFDYREGQKQLVSDVYRSIAREKVLFAQAPTGSGKTISTIFPAVKAVGENKGDRIFYLTAKTITRVVARDTFRILGERGYRGKTVLLTAKDKICPLEERKCNPDDCPYAKGHYDRVNDAVYDFIQENDLMDRDAIFAFAEERRVCPFEFSLDISSWCDNVICDYNYVFDPRVSLKRFFAEGVKGDYIFLVDEAHNLVERAREMYSATLIKEDVLYVKSILKPFGKNLERALERMNKIMLAWKKACEKRLMLTDIDEFIYASVNAAGEIEKFLEKKIPLEHQEQVLDFYFELRNFLSLTDHLGDDYRIYTEFLENGDFAFHLFCVDPSTLLQERLDRGRATVFFSATLLPVNYYKKLLCHVEPYAIYANSIFNPSNRKILISRDATSKYTVRGEEEYQKYANYIQNIVAAKEGNYMVFFPSYKFMNAVFEKVGDYPTDWELMIQESHMSEQERDQFLSRFEEDRTGTLVAFCVMGGIFSEGIDLTAEKLIGAIIVGTGLPQVSNEREVLKEYFDTNGENGFSFSYLYPGMNKVEQAAGRVIRTTEDIGVVALLDHRFLNREYQNCFPREWQDYTVCSLEDVRELANAFWDAKKCEEKQENV